MLIKNKSFLKTLYCCNSINHITQLHEPAFPSGSTIDHLVTGIFVKFIVIGDSLSNYIHVLSVCISLGAITYLRMQVMVPVPKNQQLGLFCFFIFYFRLTYKLQYTCCMLNMFLFNDLLQATTKFL